MTLMILLRRIETERESRERARASERVRVSERERERAITRAPPCIPVLFTVDCLIKSPRRAGCALGLGFRVQALT